MLKVSSSAGALAVAIGLGEGNIQFTFYLVALTGMGMLATTGVVVSEDTLVRWPTTRGIAEMSGPVIDICTAASLRELAEPRRRREHVHPARLWRERELLAPTVAVRSAGRSPTGTEAT